MLFAADGYRFAVKDFSRRKEVAEIVSGCSGMDAAGLVKCVEDEVRSLGSGPPGDDIAMLALKLNGVQNGEAPGP